MRLRFYVDPQTGDPHIHSHGVTEDEVEEVLSKPLDDRHGSDGSWVAIGQTEAGRYLRVIYARDQESGSRFVITAYEPGPKSVKALRRRRRRRP